MRTLSPRKLIVLTLLLLTAWQLTIDRTGKAGPHQTTVRHLFDTVEGWRPGDYQPLSDKIVAALELDDYVMRSFIKDKQPVTLYIGFYRTADKVGAAHDPMVCFTGQGWQLGDRTKGTYTLTSRPDLRVSFSSMLAERQGEKELVVYWFQTNGLTANGTFGQKVDMVRERLAGGSENNAFIRLSSPLADGSAEEARSRIFAFIETFYPILHRHVTGS